MKDKYPHLYEYRWRLDNMGHFDKDFYLKYYKEICSQLKEETIIERQRWRMGGTKEIHQIEKDER